MRNLSETFGLRPKEIWAVRWLDHGKMRQREFDSQFEARAHYDQIGKNMNFDRQLLKAYRETWVQSLLSWEFRWMNHFWNVWFVMGIALVFVWGLVVVCR